MRGIREEWIKNLLDIAKNNIDAPGMNLLKIVSDNFLNHCEELNEWKQIDSNTPTDKPILLFYPDHKMPEGHLEPYIAAMKYNELSRFVYTPTCWQELPSLPNG